MKTEPGRVDTPLPNLTMSLISQDGYASLTTRLSSVASNYDDKTSDMSTDYTTARTLD